ncbi:hypothetical protein Tco_1086671 [Tanacetum coccineum]
MMKDRILKDYWREIFNEGEEKDDHKEFKTNAVLEIILDKMNETWFSSTSNDKDDLEGMIDYLEPNLYNGFTGPGNERKCKLLGIIYREAPTILIERVKVTRYNIGPSETYTKTKILGIYEIPRTSANVATVHAVIMDEVNTEGGAKRGLTKNLNFQIKSQFKQELREDTFTGNKKGDAHEHVERILDIASLFNILGVTHDLVMLRVFPITLTGAAKRWVDRLTPGTVNTWDLLKKAFIQRYCPLSKTAKQLEEFRNFKQEGDETLYQAWERYNNLLYKRPTHYINSQQKVNIFYNGLSTMNCLLLDAQGPIPGMTPARALTNISSNSNSDRIAAIVSKLDNLGRDMKKLKENVHGIQVGCKLFEGPNLVKECPLNEETKIVEEVKYGKFGRPFRIN